MKNEILGLIDNFVMPGTSNLVDMVTEVFDENNSTNTVGYINKNISKALFAEIKPLFKEIVDNVAKNEHVFDRTWQNHLVCLYYKKIKDKSWFKRMLNHKKYKIILEKREKLLNFSIMTWDLSVFDKRFVDLDFKVKVFFLNPELDSYNNKQNICVSIYDGKTQITPLDHWYEVGYNK